MWQQPTIRGGFSFKLQSTDVTCFSPAAGGGDETAPTPRWSQITVGNIVLYVFNCKRWGFLKEQQRQQEDIFIFRSNDHLKLNRQLVLFLSHWCESLCQSNTHWAQRINPTDHSDSWTVRPLRGSDTHCQDRRWPELLRCVLYCWYQSVHVGQLSMLSWRWSRRDEYRLAGVLAVC